MKRSVLFIVTLICLFISQSHAAQSTTRDCREKGILTQLCSYRDSSIIAVHEEKYYLNVERICVYENGLYLNSDFFGLVPLSNLIHDDIGIYTLGWYDHYICNRCGLRYRNYPSSCDGCGGTSFTRVNNLDD